MQVLEKSSSVSAAVSLALHDFWNLAGKLCESGFAKQLYPREYVEERFRQAGIQGIVFKDKGQDKMEIQEKISEYMEALRTQKTAKNTIEAYRRDLNQMADSLLAEHIFDLDSVRELTLQSYIWRMEQSGRRPATVARAVASIKAFFRYLERNGDVAQNPALQLKAPHIEKEIPHVLTPEETVRLLKQPDGDSVKSIRDRAMLELLYATGIRVSELIQLRLEDVNLSMEYLLCSQSKRERVIPFGRSARRALEEYLEHARPVLIQDASQQLLFTNLSGQKMSRQGFWKLVRQYAKAAGIEGEITPHTLRHSFAAHLVNNGADLYAVQEMMGFADLSAAQAYAKMHRVSVREEYTKAHPRE